MSALFAALAKLYPDLAADVEAKRCAKHQHPSRGAAEAHLRAMLKRDETLVDPDSLGVYECLQKCGRGVWHTGHDKRRGQPR